MKPPPDEPEPVTAGNHAPHALAASGNGHEVVVGEMCPQGAMGRPGLVPLVMRSVGWTDNATDITNVVERGSTPRYVVFGTDGRPAGVFDTLGTADVGMAQPIASGGYSGSSPCSYAITGAVKGAQKGSGAGSAVVTRGEEPACTVATMGCGLAVAEVTRPDDPPEVPTFSTGGACVSGDSLAVDIDGDGVAELFPLRDLLDGVRGPASEWLAGTVTGAACEPKFQVYDIPLRAEAEPGGQPDPKAQVTMDVLGVLDLDGDGHREVVLALRFATSRSVVVYSSTGQIQRLELAGEGTSFPR
nr:hypothetical protein [Kofleriaceae bacterium]